MKSLINAFKFLTLARRLDGADMPPAAIGAAIVYFPIVGLIFGLVLVGINSILEPHLESEILAAVHVTILILLTGAVHLQELQQTFDRAPVEEGLQGLHASAVGVAGLLAVVLAVFFKIRSLEVIGEGRHLTLLALPVLARWPVALFFYGSGTSSEPARGIADTLKGWHVLVSSVVTLGIAAYGLRLTGLWVALAVSVVALLARAVVQQYCGGLRPNHLGAVVELSETLSFVLIASL